MTVQRMQNGYVQMQGGYDAATAMAQGGGQDPTGQAQFQQPIQPQTQLGQQVQQALPQQAILQDPASPLSMVPPNMPRLPWSQPQQQAQLQQPFQPQQQFQPQFQAQPQQQVQQQVQPMHAPAGVDLNARAYGANIPQELQGRTVGEIIGIANGLRQVHLSTLAQAQPQQVQRQPNIAVQSQPNQVQQPAFDWRQPEVGIGRVVDDRLAAFEQRIGQVFQPLIQSGRDNATQNARNTAAAEIPNFAQIEPLILQRLQGINPAALEHPDTWRVAARVAIGDLALHGQRQQMGLAQPQQPGIYPAQQVAPGQNPAPNLNSFFSETPMQGGPGPQGGSPQLTQQQLAAANAMGMSPMDYAAWNTGTPAPQAQPFGGRR